MSKSVDSNLCACVPDTAGKTAMTAFVIILIAAVVLTVMILLQNNPNLNTIFFPVFGVIGGLGIFFFIGAAINMCKRPGTTVPAKVPVKKSKTEQQSQQPIYMPAYGGVPYTAPQASMHPHMMIPYALRA